MSHFKGRPGFKRALDITSFAVTMFLAATLASGSDPFDVTTWTFRSTVALRCMLGAFGMGYGKASERCARRAVEIDSLIKQLHADLAAKQELVYAETLRRLLTQQKESGQP